MKYYLSTVADLGMDEEEGKDPVIYYLDRTAPVSKEYGMGLEIAEFCIAENLDDNLAQADEEVRRKMAIIPDIVFHAPYNELCPCAIDSRVRAVAAFRFDQAYEAALRYGAPKIVIHAGYQPVTYYKEYFITESIKFWKTFLAEHPADITYCLENVTEPEPEYLIRIIDGVDDPRFKMCLDIGHANLTGTAPMEWLEACGTRVSHMHIHDNFGAKPDGPGSAGDLHLCPGKGTIDIEGIPKRAEQLIPDATVTVESWDTEGSAAWLRGQGFI